MFPLISGSKTENTLKLLHHKTEIANEDEELAQN